MRRYRLFLLFSFCLSNLFCFAQYGNQFENRGFENWANFGSSNSTNEPLHWHSGMSASGSFSGFLSQQIEPSIHSRPGSSGTQSARLWPKSVIGVTANGNMTNGRMNAGSMSATGSGNYNYTQRSDERFNTPLTVVPDSLTVWVCFRSASASQEAEARAAVHGDVDFKLISDGTMEPADQLVALASEYFTRTAEAGGDYNWRRLSIPFDPSGPCNDPRYILFTITTNKTPGEGATSDDLFVDDVLLVYNPSIRMGAIEKDHFLLGDEVTIPYTLTGTMSPDNLNKPSNQVIVQLSAANGSFSDPIELGRFAVNTSGALTVTIPQGIYSGEHYRIRLVTTNYPMISEDNGTDLTIYTEDNVAENQGNRLNVYPNPANHVIHCASEEKMTEVALFTLTGERVWSSKEMSESIDIPVSGLNAGIYLVKCHFGMQSIVRNVIIN